MEKKYSIKQQIFIWVSFIVILVVLLNIAFNNFFLEKVYLIQQKQSIIEVYHKLSSQNLDENDLKDLYQECIIKNITLFVTDEQFKPILYSYDNYGEEAKQNLIDDIKSYVGRDNELKIPKTFNREKASNNYLNQGTLIEQAENYSIYRRVDYKTGLENMELRCQLSDGKNLLIRVSIDNLMDNLSLFNTFSSIILLLGLSIGICLSWFLCKRLSNPIKELTNISEKMIKFNFDTKYNFTANNEIDILGKNFNTLSDELNKTLSELKAANKQLEKDIEEKIKIDEMRKDFISNVSHELKTPIALIQGYTEALKEGIGDDKETNDYYLDIIMDESLRMNKLVKQLIDLNQLESNMNPISLEEFDICELVKGISNTYKVMAKEKGVNVQLNFEKDNMICLSDEFKIEQIIVNYFTNAFNHVDYDKEIIVNVFEEGENIKFTIFNTGNLIPEEDIEYLWVKFYKVDKARTRAYGGSGIGLSIVKAIMNSLNQDFGVQNEENGVMFWFTVKKA